MAASVTMATIGSMIASDMLLSLLENGPKEIGGASYPEVVVVVVFAAPVNETV